MVDGGVAFIVCQLGMAHKLNQTLHLNSFSSGTLAVQRLCWLQGHRDDDDDAVVVQFKAVHIAYIHPFVLYTGNLNSIVFVVVVVVIFQ